MHNWIPTYWSMNLIFIEKTKRHEWFETFFLLCFRAKFERKDVLFQIISLFHNIEKWKHILLSHRTITETYYGIKVVSIEDVFMRIYKTEFIIFYKYCAWTIRIRIFWKPESYIISNEMSCKRPSTELNWSILLQLNRGRRLARIISIMVNITYILNGFAKNPSVCWASIKQSFHFQGWISNPNVSKIKWSIVVLRNRESLVKMFLS